MLNVAEAIQTRQSIRQYKPDPVPVEHILQVLEAARLAPSGGNCQPWRFLVITDAEERRRLRKEAKCQLFIEQTPVVIVVGADLSTYTLEGRRKRRLQMGLPEMPEAPIDPFWAERAREALAAPERPAAALHARHQAALNCGIGVQQMVLMATALGLGTCWIGAFNREGLRRMYSLPESVELIALLPMGYPAEDPPRKPRLPLEAILLRPLSESLPPASPGH